MSGGVACGHTEVDNRNLPHWIQCAHFITISSGMRGQEVQLCSFSMGGQD